MCAADDLPLIPNPGLALPWRQYRSQMRSNPAHLDFAGAYSNLEHCKCTLQVEWLL